jgi:hypothetical protein
MYDEVTPRFQPFLDGKPKQRDSSSSSSAGTVRTLTDLQALAAALRTAIWDRVMKQHRPRARTTASMCQAGARPVML